MKVFFDEGFGSFCTCMRIKNREGSIEIEWPITIFSHFFFHMETTKRKNQFYLVVINATTISHSFFYFIDGVCRNKTGIFYLTFFLAALSTATFYVVYVCALSLCMYDITNNNMYIKKMRNEFAK